jgi:hypothetical protein
MPTEHRLPGGNNGAERSARSNDGKHAVVFTDNQEGVAAAYSFYIAAF